MSFKYLSFLAFCLFLAGSLYGQPPLALPQIVNYSYDQYKAGIQNWDVAEDKQGRLYFGNNEGLLTFNGRFWNSYQLPNFTVVRSVKIDNNGRIYVGGQDEIGYFYPNDQGVLIYHSLMDLIPVKERKFADVWDIELLGEEVFFRSVNKIIHYKDQRIHIYKGAPEWAFLGKGNNQIYAQAKDKGLMVYQDGIWQNIVSDHIMQISAITSILPYSQNTLLVSTLKHGLFLLNGRKLKPFNTKLDQRFYNDRIYCATQVNQDWYAFGTTSAGIIIMDRAGAFVQQYAYEEGLQKSNIRGMLVDRNKRLWAALDDGVDVIGINSAIKNIYPDKNKQATGYAMSLYKNVLYIGTSNGLYASPVNPSHGDISLSAKNFVPVRNAEGQVWSLKELNGQLLMGHEDGAFSIRASEASKISVSGTWLFNPLSASFPAGNVLAGSYFGLQHLKYKDGTFIHQGQLSGVNDSFRFLSYDPGSNTAWASHPNRGVYRLKISPDFSRIVHTKIYGKKEGLPATLHNYLFTLKGRRVIATEKGLYEYDVATDTFKPSPLFEGALADVPLQYLKEDQEGNVWLVSDKQVGVIEAASMGPGKAAAIIYLPELNGKTVTGFESIYVLNQENVFIGGSRGVYHINYKKYKAFKTKPEVLMGQVKLLGKSDSVIFGGYFMKDQQLAEAQDPASVLKLRHDHNSIHFEYAFTLFEQSNNVQFSYQLKGFDKQWSTWTSKSEKDYTNLMAGHYTFQVKSRNNLGSESDVVSYEFYIRPVWYQSTLAYIAYILILVLVIYLVFRWQRIKYLKAQDHLSYLHQLEVDRNEKEITTLKNEKLEADMDFKNRELATMTMNLVQRGEVLARVKEVISTLVRKHEAPDNSHSFRHLLRLIRDVEKGDDNKTQFTLHFNKVNEDFFNKLKDKFPELTPNELKLCAYLKLNLSTKEIAQMMNITLKAVEVARYRLRKKLNLRPDVNLYDFLTLVSRGIVYDETRV